MEAILSISTPPTIQIVLEYGELAARQKLSDHEADRMEEILTLANDDSALSFWIDEVDHCLGHRLGLLDEEDSHLLQESAGDAEGILGSFNRCILRTQNRW